MRKVILLFMLFSSFVYAQYTIRWANFDNNDLDSGWSNVSMGGYLPVKNWTYVNGRANYYGGACSGLCQNETLCDMLTPTKASHETSDLTVQAKFIYKGATGCQGAIAIGFNYNNYISVQHNFLYGVHGKIIGRIGGSYITEEWLNTMNFNEGRYYKLEYKRNEQKTYIYYSAPNDSLTWFLLKSINTNFGSGRLRAGIDGIGSFNAGTGFAMDDVKVTYLPFDAFPPITVTAPLEASFYIGGTTANLEFTTFQSYTGYEISYSVNNGISWMVLDTVSSSPYSLTIPDESTNQGRIRVKGLTSEQGVFTEAHKPGIISVRSSVAKTLKITSLSPASVVQNFAPAKIRIKWQYSNISKFNLYFETGGMWQFIGRAAGNEGSAAVDTMSYVWTPPLTLSGTINIKIEEDIQLESDIPKKVSVSFIGNRVLYPGMICHYADGDSPVEWYGYYDPSCRWSPNASKTQYTFHVQGDGAGMKYSLVTGPYKEGSPFRYSSIQVISGQDTISVNPAGGMFYPNFGQSVVVDGRRYFIAGDSLMADDLVNGIYHTPIAYIGDILQKANRNGSAFLTEPVLFVYDIDVNSLLTKGPYNLPFNFQSLNPPLFRKAVILQSTAGYLADYYFEPLPYPAASSGRLSDVYSENIKITSLRGTLRGIYPKAGKK